MPILLEVTLFLLTGIATGVLSSVFGLGGGMTVVPVSYLIFHLLGYPDDVVMHVALGSSMAVMLVTVINGIIRHYRAGNILLDVVQPMFMLLGLGAIVGAVCSYFVHSDFLRYLFMAFVVLVIFNAIFDKSFSQSHELKDRKPFEPISRAIIAFFVGGLSVLLGIGGSVMTIPYFRKHGLPMANTSACALSLTPIVAVFGLIGYLIAGWHAKGLPPHSIGFVSIPAAASIAVGTFVGVPIGIKLIRFLEDGIIAKCYILLLIVMLVVMIV